MKTGGLYNFGKDPKDVQSAVMKIDTSMKKPDGHGFVYLIGAGPGDPGLLTIKGAKAIAASDIVIYDYLVHPDILSHAKPGAELIYVGKQGGVRSISQEEINRLLITRAAAGLTVARLKGGDPFVFGRGGEEAEALAEAGIEWEVVPGVSSGVAAAAYAGIPITHRDYSSSVSFITGHNGRGKRRPPIDWPSVARQADTLVIFMCAGAVAEIAAGLIAGGRPRATPMAVIRWGSYEHQEVYIGTIQDALNANRAISSPAIAIVGEVVTLRERLRWFGPESEFQLAAELPLGASLQPEVQIEASPSLLEAAKS
jgi:uroporphyrinogen III methyltransferase / synthase